MTVTEIMITAMPHDFRPFPPNSSGIAMNRLMKYAAYNHIDHEMMEPPFHRPQSHHDRENYQAECKIDIESQILHHMIDAAKINILYNRVRSIDHQ